MALSARKSTQVSIGKHDSVKQAQRRTPPRKKTYD
jgi:hypothetical protein